MSHFIDDQADVSDWSETDSQIEFTQPHLELFQDTNGRPFPINCKRILFTYTHFNETPEILLARINDIRRIKRGIACLELHQDGEPHCHAAIEFETKVHHVDGRRLFDLDGTHPNLQTGIRSWGACVNYCRKEGVLEIAIYGEATAEDLIRAGGGSYTPAIDTSDVFGVARASATFESFAQWCISARISSAWCILIWQHARGSQAPTILEDVPLPAVVNDVQLRTFGWTEHVRTLVVCGPSGVGKTSWALAHAPKPALLVTDVDDLQSYDANHHRSIIFDEIRCNGARDHNGRWVGAWPLTSQIKLVTWDTPCSIRIRYKLARIPAHVPKVFTCTDTICFTYDEQINRRIEILNLYTDREISGLWDV